MGAYKQGLRICVTYAADTARAAECIEIFFELCPEGRVCNGVDLSVESTLSVPYDHSSIAGAQMTVVIRPEENIEHNVAP